MKTLFAIGLAVAMISGAAFAAPSFLGIEGNILTPNDTVLAPGAFTAHLHSFNTDDSSPLVIGAEVGVNESLELGVGHYDPDNDGIDAQTFVNAKYSVMPETRTMPSLVIGATDVTANLDNDEDPGFFILIGKNLTPVATDMTGEPSAPMRGTLGYGGGMYGGFFAGLNWTLSPKVSVMAEYVDKASIKGLFYDETLINIGARISLTNDLRVDGALIDGDDFAFGISYTKIGLE